MSLSIDDLKELVNQAQGACVSIYMPTYRAGTETQQNPIRFKNLIRQAESELANYSLKPTDATALLEPALQLDREELWQHQSEGLAIFIAEGAYRSFSLPFSVNELVVVGDRFHLKPLMQLLTGDGEFYILALSQQRVRLLQASRYNVQEVEVEGLPESMDAALQYDETAKEGQFRISTSKGGTNNSFQHSGTFHGQGSPDQDDVTRDILQYFHIIDRCLHEVLRDQQAPLILAGVEYLLPIYREANTYAHLMEAGITENPEILSAEELHAQALSLVEPYFSQAEKEAIDHYHELQGTGKTSADVKEVIPAAYYGRIEQLFVAVGVQQWGSFDPQSSELEIHSDTQPGDEDLLNSAAIQTLLNGGEVYAMEPNEVPGEAPVAAVFRY